MSIEDILNAHIKAQYDTKARFAKHIGINPTTLQEILKRGFDTAKVTNAAKICAGLGISLDELLGISKEDSFDYEKAIQLYEAYRRNPSAQPIVDYILQYHEDGAAPRSAADMNGQDIDSIVMDFVRQETERLGDFFDSFCLEYWENSGGYDLMLTSKTKSSDSDNAGIPGGSLLLCSFPNVPEFGQKSDSLPALQQKGEELYHRYRKMIPNLHRKLKA